MHHPPSSRRAGVPDALQVLPSLVHVQLHLEGDLSLAALARQAGQSPFQFHRRFKSAVGETPKQYVDRLRLEWSAFRLVMHRASIAAIAFECGYRDHETYARAFRRRFGTTPTAYRNRHRFTAPGAGAKGGKRDRLEELLEGYELSATRVQEFAQLHLAFIRHVGPYETVSDEYWHRLDEWWRRKRLPGLPIYLGIAHDAPGITPPEKLRFDAAVRLPGPIEAEPGIGYQTLTIGEAAVTRHVGPYRTLPAAYGVIFSRLPTLTNYRVVGLPCVEVFHTARVDARHELNRTDICIPVTLKKAVS
jgi:AraC family transcriptional regulator